MKKENNSNVRFGNSIFGRAQSCESIDQGF